MLADVLARPLIQGTDENASERAGVGAAMIAGVGAGVFNGYEEACKFAPMFTAVTEPNPDPPRSINPITGDSLMLADVAFRFASLSTANCESFGTQTTIRPD
jgi:hypothetical protein